MPARIIRLIYPPTLVHEPILYRLIKRFNVQVNIRQAQISLEEGWLEVELSGESTELELAVSFLAEHGIEIISTD
ncbi:MAG: FeS-binding protein [Anaerolineales bacterium]|nr:FeS-binding protein [Anaerolineales bacterium]